ncbi:response regulator transcription factor [Terrilactibacillus laevilacticus]|uniref:response regulator transcription factor n=1 Tax=Terrilactibacillus laevilacticus TaxID=1380157 RepID=UPI001C66ECEF|nr:response regulator transcription factor [Terrilactibacillus laevilacticus]
MLNILIVDDDALIRDSLKLMINLEDDLNVVDTCENGQIAIESYHKHHPDVILMDIRMPVMDGVQCTKKIRDLDPNIKIIILTTFKEDEYIKEALKNGAAGYILKNESVEGIIENIRTVYRGNVVIHADIASKLPNLIRETPTKKRKDDLLTEREITFLKLVAEGLSNKEIAKELFLSEGTVRNYITKLLEKLDLKRRTQLAIYYLKREG